MDNRRLSSMDVLTSGILNIPAPQTDVPEDREVVHGCDEDWQCIGHEAIVAALEAGKLVESSNYYGIPFAWKSDDGMYRGVLLQYRSVTEDETFATADAAAEWFEKTHYETYG